MQEFMQAADIKSTEPQVVTARRMGHALAQAANPHCPFGSERINGPEQGSWLASFSYPNVDRSTHS